MAPVAERLTCLKWYQVVFAVGDRPGCEVRGRVQAATPDRALRAVMRLHGAPFTRSASIWLLGRAGAPSTRVNVRCRLPAGRVVVRSV